MRPIQIFSTLVALLSVVSAQQPSVIPRKSPVYTEEFQHTLPIPPVKRPLTTYHNKKTGKVVDFYEIRIKSFKKNIFKGLGDANFVGYDGMVPGPTFRVPRGRETLCYLKNFTVFDGWAEDMIPKDHYKDYYYPNAQNARTLWYHDHSNGKTAVNVNSGQAGFYIIEDAEVEQRLCLPQGKYDIPLMISARFWAANGDLPDISAPGPQYGDTYSVNGQISPYLDVESRKYRFRILNASVGRTSNFTIEDGKGRLLPFHVVGSDAGFMSKRVETKSLVVAPAERWEIIVDFGATDEKTLMLRTAQVFSDQRYEISGNIMQFRIAKSEAPSLAVIPLPNKLVDLDLPKVTNALVTKTFVFGRTGTLWTINGKTFHDPKNRLVENVPFGTTEKWILRGGAGWSHPVHIHLVDFQIIKRVALGPTGRDYLTEYERFAMKDIAAVGSEEEVHILAKYAPWDGLYMFHCHNLAHEDDNMMAAFNVTNIKTMGYKDSKFSDPMTAEFRAKPYKGTTDLVEVKSAVLERYSNMGAYEKNN
ncbi:Cupredoxin [Pyronema domesticum]|nr:Cupredoxin [Pyronema domesticum]